MSDFECARQQKLVRRDEKHQQLEQLIEFFLDRVHADIGKKPCERSVTLLARSPASPVAEVLLENARDLIDAGGQLQVLFAGLEPSERLGDWLDPLVVTGENSVSAVVRWAKNQMLLEAHEQLVLGEQMSWSGDSMRRDPLLQDSLELFEPACRQAARHASMAFRAIWKCSQPIPSRLSRSHAGEVHASGLGANEAAELAASNAAQNSARPGPNTRH